MGGKLIVRCRQGHLFTTFWAPRRIVQILTARLVALPAVSCRQALVADGPGG